MGIGKKLYASFGLVIVLLLGVLSYTYVNFNAQSQAVDWNNHTYEVIGETNLALESLVNMETGLRGFAITGTENFLEPLNQGKAEFSEHYNKVKELTADNPKQQERLEKLNNLEQQWIDSQVTPLLDLRRLVTSGNATMDDVINFEKAAKGKVLMDEMRVVIDDIINEELTLLNERAQKAERLESLTKNVIIFGGLASIVMGLVIATAITKAITTPVNSMVVAAERAASGDLTNQIEINSQDEIGKLGKAFNDMIGQMNELITQVKHKSAVVSQSAQNLNSSSEQTTASANETAATMSEIASTVDQVSENIQEISSASISASEHASAGNNGIVKLTSQMQSIATSSREAYQVINGLSTTSQEIGQIVELITAIAEQTNLLALNAAIEAARAGEQGRGFAVVAEEVRKLAEQSANAAKQIKDLINAIQNESQNAVDTMAKGERDVVEGTQVVKEVGESFSEIISAVQGLTTQIQDVASATEQMSAGVQNVAASAEEQTAAMEEVSASSETLNNLADELNQLVDKFKV